MLSHDAQYACCLTDLLKQAWPASSAAAVTASEHGPKEDPG